MPTNNPLWIGLAAGIAGSLLMNAVFFGILKPKAEPSSVNQDIVSDDTTDTKSGGTRTAPASFSIENIVSSASPAVVAISISKDMPVYEQYIEESPSPFDNFGFPSFKIPRQRQTGTEKKEVGGGSGFIISANGYIVTNNHVIADESASYTVITSDGTEYPATVVAKDSVLDIAVVHIDATNLPFLKFGNSDSLKAGQTVIAIGNPLNEFRNTVSVGVVSGLARSITAQNGRSSEQLEGLIQTDAAINPGNSGGPLLDKTGKVIGVNVAVAGGAENIGFAIPSNLVQSTADSIIANGRVVRPYIGVRYVNVTKAVKEKFALTTDDGAFVLGDGQSPAVIDGSPADKAGILEKDVVISVDSEKINEEHTLAGLIRRKKVGDTVSLEIMRDGKTMTLKLTLEELPQTK